MKRGNTMYNNIEILMNTMLDFIACKPYFETGILQPQIINIYADLEKQYTL